MGNICYRYLSTSASCDHLNYNSASDTSERYFTADGNGVDTADDLDTPNRRSLSKESLLRTGIVIYITYQSKYGNLRIIVI